MNDLSYRQNKEKEIRSQWLVTVYEDGTTKVRDGYGMLMQYHKGWLFSRPKMRVIHYLHPYATDSDWDDFPDEDTAQSAIKKYMKTKPYETKPRSYTYP